MKKLKITTGKWISEYRDGIISEDAGDPGDAICDAPEWAEMSMKRWPANASLICDAGNTYQKCGLLPSELLEQRDELLQTLQQIERGVTGLPLQALQIIDSIEKQENETK